MEVVINIIRIFIILLLVGMVVLYGISVRSFLAEGHQSLNFVPIGGMTLIMLIVSSLVIMVLKDRCYLVLQQDTPTNINWLL
jgi:hypothetical protein